MTNTIMAIDLGRYKSVVCFYQRDTRYRQRQEKTLHRKAKELGYELKKIAASPAEEATPTRS